MEEFKIYGASDEAIEAYTRKVVERTNKLKREHMPKRYAWDSVLEPTNTKKKRVCLFVPSSIAKTMNLMGKTRVSVYLELQPELPANHGK